MPEPLQSVVYTATALVEGGREGHGPSRDGRFVVDLSVPESMGGSAQPGNNHEELFAVGYAACFQSALLSVAVGRRLDASESQIICRVGFGPTGHGGFGLTVAPDLHAPLLTREQGADLMARGCERSPYSDGTWGNMDAALPVDGVLLPSRHSGPAAGCGEPA